MREVAHTQDSHGYQNPRYDTPYNLAPARVGRWSCASWTIHGPVGKVGGSGGNGGGKGGGLIIKAVSSGTVAALCHCSKPSRQTSTSLAFETREKIAVKSAKDNGPTVLSPTA